MKLYHYSKELFDSLKTRRIRGDATPKEIEEGLANAKKYYTPGSYNDHISFFFDPLPLKTICRLCKGQNDFYVKGNKIYEYTVDVNSLDHAVTYLVTETPNQMEMRDDPSLLWETDYEIVAYCKKEYLANIECKEIGYTLSDLKKQINIFVGKTEKFYIAASKRSDFDENIKKYAANVPHVMLYPSSGIVEYESVSKAVSGSDERFPLHTKLNKHLVKPALLSW